MQVRKGLLPIDHCELILIHVMPVGEETKMASKGKKEVSSFLTSEVHTTQSGRSLYVKMMQLAQKHYQLSSTTVTGIPMKEEQNASSSANYDVELLHPADVHVELLKTAHLDGLVINSKEGLNIETVTLKWCTPKSNVAELHHCTSVFRITPVDVNSRPSSCLTNFLLGGRSVMLEQPRKTGTKVISHMLASHGGEIFIHAINTCRSILEDPPSISEGCGGRVTDYRITDFGEFMKENRLAPVPAQTILESAELPIERALNQLERKTRHWPIVIGETIIFNMPNHLEPLPTLMVKETLDDEEVLECKKVIYHIVGMESKNEALPVPSTGSRGKGLKREEQYRQMWSELEMLVRVYSTTSDQHNKVLDCLLELKKPSPEDFKPTTSAPPKKAPEKAFVKEEKMDTSNVEKGLKELDRFQMMTEREKQDFLSPERLTPESPPAKRFRPSLESSITRTGGPQNLLSMWTNRLSAISSKRHSEFSGRLESSGNVAELYQHLNENKGEGETELSTSNTNGKR
ncbi:integrator complex subunit 13-like isoform X2 [Liolophura sinensis]|uniref:integrator complex subunit 13-like isoform X2 n=1 Tax=Liolophura sinensis TaxID=3198878 RepID=UPI0031595902